MLAPKVVPLPAKPRRAMPPVTPSRTPLEEDLMALVEKQAKVVVAARAAEEVLDRMHWYHHGEAVACGEKPARRGRAHSRLRTALAALDAPA